MGKGIPQKASFHHLFTANVYDGGCKRLRWRLQTFAGKDANVCGETRQCTARTDAVHCKGGCSALPERLQCTASEMGKTGIEIASPILDKRTGRKDASFGLLHPSMKILPSPDFRRWAYQQKTLLSSCRKESFRYMDIGVRVSPCCPSGEERIAPVTLKKP